MRNLLTNGGFEFDQEHEGDVLSLPCKPAQHSLKFADGWIGSNLSATIPMVTVQRKTNSTGRYCARLEVTSPATTAMDSNEELRIYANIGKEDGVALMYGTPYAKQTSISFKVKSSIAGTFVFTLANGNPDPSHRRCLYKMFHIAVAGVEQVVTIDGIPGCTDGDWPMGDMDIWGYMCFQTCVGTDYVDSTSNEKVWRPLHVACDNTIDNTMRSISGAYLEIADVMWTATPTAQSFEHDPYEINRVERRYQKSYNSGVKPATSGTAPSCYKGAWYRYMNMTSGGVVNAIGDGVPFRGRMVGAPSITMYSPVTGASGNIRNFSGSDTGVTVYEKGETGFTFYTNGTVPTPLSVLGHWVADSRL